MLSCAGIRSASSAAGQCGRARVRGGSLGGPAAVGRRGPIQGRAPARRARDDPGRGGGGRRPSSSVNAWSRCACGPWPPPVGGPRRWPCSSTSAAGWMRNSVSSLVRNFARQPGGPARRGSAADRRVRPHRRGGVVRGGACPRCRDGVRLRRPGRFRAAQGPRTQGPVGAGLPTLGGGPHMATTATGHRRDLRYRQRIRLGSYPRAGRDITDDDLGQGNFRRR